jgi:hypothetical protein
VRALDLPQVLDLEERLRTAGDVVENGSPPTASPHCRKVGERSPQATRRGQPALTGVSDHGQAGCLASRRGFL